MKQFGTSTVIYTKNGCPFCVEAKRILSEKGYSYTEILIDGVSNTKATMCKDLGQELATVPQIVLEGVFVPGGCAGLKKKLHA